MQTSNQQPAGTTVIRRRRVVSDRTAGYDYVKVSSGKMNRMIKGVALVMVTAISAYAGLSLGSYKPQAKAQQMSEAHAMQVAVRKMEQLQQAQMAHDLWLTQQYNGNQNVAENMAPVAAPTTDEPATAEPDSTFGR